ncbi:MAG: VTT domain-containing protein [Candidatus Aenigmatarchaeota archaeon]
MNKNVNIDLLVVMVEFVLHYIISNLPYLGMFILSMMTSASILIPLPGQLVIVLAVVLKLNPFLTALFVAGGSMTGEMLSYFLGLISAKIVKDEFEKQNKLLTRIKKYYHKYAFWIIFVTALLFFPFDLVGMLSGVSRYDVRKFLIAGFLGKFLKSLILFVLIQAGIQISKFIIL